MRDSEVVASIVAGNPDGLAAAYDRYADRLYTYCRSMLKDPADAADAVQDTFVIAASRLDGLRDPGRLRAWLYAVARNECLRILRAQKGTSGLDAVAGVSDESADVSRDAERADLRALLRDASAGLNPGEREVIELQLRQGLEAAEVASVLGVSRNHAHSLLSRARDQLESCLGVLLVGRSGREDCRELGSMLSDWDGRLTVLLRKRLNRHIEHCGTCAGRKALVLKPAAFLGLSPLAAMAAAAAESLRLAPRVPAPLKGHALALAAGSGPSAAAHQAAVLSRAGSFGRAGFPKALHASGAGTPHPAAGARGSFLKSPRGQAVAAGVVLAVAVASVAFALTGDNGTAHLALSGSKPPGHSSGSASSAPPLGGHGGGHRSEPARRQPPATPAHASRAASPPPVPGTVAATPARVPVTVITSPRQPPASKAPASPPPASSTPTGTAPASSPSATASPTTVSPGPSRSASAPPAPPAGTLAASPAGGLLIIPPGGATITLTAQDGAVTWNITVSGGTGRVTVSPSSGTLQPGQSATVTITAATLAVGQTLAVSPGATVFTVLIGWTRPFAIPGLPPLRP